MSDQTNLKFRPRYRAGLEVLQKYHRENTNPTMSMTFILEELIEKERKRLKLKLPEKVDSEGE